jgi:large subunit ribosomal protein L34
MPKTKRTYQPHKKRRIRKLGFLARMETNGGQNVIKARRAKKRTKISVSDEFRVNKAKKFSKLT